MQAVDDAGHVLAVVDVGGLGEEDARQADVLHGGEPVVDVVGVAEVEAVQLVLGLVLVVDALEGHLLGAEEVGQLGQVHAVAQVLLALAGAGQLLADARLDPLLGLLQVAQVLVGDVLLALLVHLGRREAAQRVVGVEAGGGAAAARGVVRRQRLVAVVALDLLQAVVHF